MNCSQLLTRASYRECDPQSEGEESIFLHPDRDRESRLVKFEKIWCVAATACNLADCTGA